MRTPFGAVLIAGFAGFAVAAGCYATVHPTPPPATAPAKDVALSGAAIMIGAGDIANCDQHSGRATARLIDSVLKADSVAKVPDAVFTLGDNAYPSGTTANFADCFTPTWGDPAKSIMSKIHPVPGNHDYETPRAAPYFRYFGAKAGEPGFGYYSYDVGTWHVVALNSEIVVLGSFSVADRKAQEAWLLKDLTDHKKPCTLAYWHEPRFSSGYHGSDASFTPIWRILYDNGVDLVLNGHDHNYERFAPQTPDGIADSTKGITQIVAGTGGSTPRGFGGRAIANSVVQIEGHPGVLVLTLGAAEFRSAFLDDQARVWDPSGGKCR